MDRIIEYYTIHKFALSVIFSNGKRLMNKTLGEKDENEDKFFDIGSLDYVNKIMQDMEPSYVLDENKKMIVREYLKSYIIKYCKDKDKVPIIEKCNNILYNLGVSNFKFVYRKVMKKFNQKKPREKYQNELIVKQYAYLRTLCSDKPLPLSLFDDAMCLKAIHIFIEECPILLHNPVFLSNVQEIISKEKNDKDVAILLFKVRESIEQMKKEREEIAKICQRHYMTSLIFTTSQDFTMILDSILETVVVGIGKEKFFSNKKITEELNKIFNEIEEEGVFSNEKIIKKLNKFFSEIADEELCSNERIIEELHKNFNESGREKFFSNEIITEQLNKIFIQIGKKEFFSSENFEIFKDVVLTGLDDCIFDQEKRENISCLLRYYEGQSTDVINDIKRKLNQPEDELWRQKNDAFYVRMARLHHGSVGFLKNHQARVQKEVALTESGKIVIDRAICSDMRILNVVFGDNEAIEELDNYPYTISGINYLINTYPEILKNPIYKDKMINILDNQGWKGIADCIVCMKAKKMIKTKCK